MDPRDSLAANTQHLSLVDRPSGTATAASVYDFLTRDAEKPQYKSYGAPVINKRTAINEQNLGLALKIIMDEKPDHDNTDMQRVFTFPPSQPFQKFYEHAAMGFVIPPQLRAPINTEAQLRYGRQTCFKSILIFIQLFQSYGGLQSFESLV